MKILHTSDWHLGHQLYDYDRLEEHSSMIDQIIEIIRDEKPDAFLISGDIFDIAQPSAAVQKFFVNSLLLIHEAYPEMTIIVTAGNHDSGTRHEVFRQPWKNWGVEMIGSIRQDADGNHLVRIKDLGYVVALPYAHERYLGKDFIQKLLDEVAEVNEQALPVVVMAHTTVRGADFRGHAASTEFTAGGIDGVDVESFGNGYDYLALGHIHHPQFIHTGRHNVRYAGSPVAVSFDENYPHSVSIVEISAHGRQPEVRTREIRNPRPLVTLPPEGTTDWESALELLKNFPDEIPAYIRLNVEVEDCLPAGAKEMAINVCKDKKCRFCIINCTKKRSGDFSDKTYTVQEFKALDPMDVAKQYIEEAGGCFDDDLAGMFRQVLDEIKEE